MPRSSRHYDSEVRTPVAEESAAQIYQIGAA
jgi:hypothetical protein